MPPGGGYVVKLLLYRTRWLPKQGWSNYFTGACPHHQEWEYLLLMLAENKGAELKDSWPGKKQERQAFDFYLLPREQWFSALWTIAFIEHRKIGRVITGEKLHFRSTDGENPDDKKLMYTQYHFSVNFYLINPNRIYKQLGKKYYTQHTDSPHKWNITYSSNRQRVWWLELWLWSPTAWISAMTSLPHSSEILNKPNPLHSTVSQSPHP